MTCFICSQFTEIHDSDEAGSPQPPGLRLPCTLEHGFCRECLLHYIQGKLNAAQPGKKTFPIACPGCVLGIPYAITENEAIRILPPDLMDRWVSTHRRNSYMAVLKGLFRKLDLRLKEENFAVSVIFFLDQTVHLSPTLLPDVVSKPWLFCPYLPSTLFRHALPSMCSLQYFCMSRL